VKTAITLVLFSLIAIMYVDDTDILLAAKDSLESVSSLHKRALKVVNTYYNGVHQTGGAIRPSKCLWYLITFEWVAGKWKYGKNPPHQCEVTIKDTNKVQQIIPRLEVHQGWKGLGVLPAPADGKWKDELQNSSKESFEMPH